MPLSALYPSTGFRLFASGSEISIVTTTFSAWTTISDGTLAGLGATYALLSVMMILEANANSYEGLEFHARQTGSAAAMGNGTRRALAETHGGYSGMGYNNNMASGDSVFPVLLDSSSQFDYYLNYIATPVNVTVTTYIIGYKLGT